MGFFLKLFTGNPLMMIWVALGIAAVSSAFGFGGGWTLQGWHLSGELERCKGDRARNRDANESFAMSVRHQTDAIRDLAEASRSRAAQAAVQAEVARKQGNLLLGRANAILTRPLPATAAEDCAALSVDLDGEITERKRRGQ